MFAGPTADADAGQPAFAACRAYRVDPDDVVDWWAARLPS